MPRVYESPEQYLREWWALRGALGLSYRSEPPADAITLQAAGRLLRRLSGGGFGLKFDADGYLRYRQWSPGARTVDYHDEYDQITCPVLLVRGTGTPLLSPDEAAATATVIGDCAVVDVENARHDVLADNPDALLEVALPFLSDEQS
jgi:pimeloyl-ACP methyl ester carboxylesterase